MSGIQVKNIVNKRLLIIITEDETMDVDRLVEEAYFNGVEQKCPAIIDTLNRISDEELREIIEKILKKRKKKTDEIPAGCG